MNGFEKQRRRDALKRAGIGFAAVGLGCCRRSPATRESPGSSTAAYFGLIELHSVGGWGIHRYIQLTRSGFVWKITYRDAGGYEERRSEAPGAFEALASQIHQGMGWAGSSDRINQSMSEIDPRFESTTIIDGSWYSLTAIDGRLRLFIQCRDLSPWIREGKASKPARDFNKLIDSILAL